MNWLVYIPSHTVPHAYPSYPKGEIAPVLKWDEYRAHIKKKGTEEYWYSNSRIDPVMGTYGCYLIRLLKADFTFGWDVADFSKYDGVIVEGEIDSCVYLREKKRYGGFIITEPRMPHGFDYSKNVIKSSDVILINHEAGMETAVNLNKFNKTDKFVLFSYPTVNVDFLTKNFFKKIDNKERRVITYRPSSGPTRENTGRVAKTMEGAKRFRTTLFRKYPRFRKLYMKTMHGMAQKIEETTSSDRLITVNKTAEYLAEFQKSYPNVKGFMTKGKNAPKPFQSVDIKEADEYYNFIGQSYIVILASATYASITFYAACVGTPSVGSKDTTMQKLLFPELAFDESDIGSIVSAMKRLFENKDFYIEQQKQGLENANKYFSDKALEGRFYDCIKEFLCA
jgi:hypothetical protein